MPEQNARDIDFSMLLASSVHDMKNSLGMLLSSIDELIIAVPPTDDAEKRRYSTLQREVARINNDLIYLLGLYRLQNDQLNINIGEIYLQDFLEERLLANDLLLEMHNIAARVDCDETLAGFFDENLVAGVLNNVIVNAARHTHGELTLSARQEQDYLVIRVADNGSGYPAEMIGAFSQVKGGIDFGSGSTKLGLFFASQIAALHQRRQFSGFIELDNPASGGACFEIYLP